MKGFGFPGASSNQPSYKADTSAKKSQLIDILQRSERMWNEEKYEESKLKSIFRFGSTKKGYYSLRIHYSKWIDRIGQRSLHNQAQITQGKTQK